jgi:subtilisin family serine protease
MFPFQWRKQVKQQSRKFQQLSLEQLESRLPPGDLFGHMLGLLWASDFSSLDGHLCVPAFKETTGPTTMAYWPTVERDIPGVDLTLPVASASPENRTDTHKGAPGSGKTSEIAGSQPRQDFFADLLGANQNLFSGGMLPGFDGLFATLVPTRETNRRDLADVTGGVPPFVSAEGGPAPSPIPARGETPVVHENRVSDGTPLFMPGGLGGRAGSAPHRADSPPTSDEVPITWRGVPATAKAGEWIVHFKGLTGSAQAEKAAAQGEFLHAGLVNLQVTQDLESDGLFLVQAPPALGFQDVQASMARLPGYDYAEPNFVVHVDSTFPNDPLFPNLWGLYNTGQAGGTPGADIHAPQAWDLTTGSSSVVVAVIDTGIDYNHPDLVANLWTNSNDFSHGYNFVNNTNDPFDDNGHGTHVAGTIGAAGNNGFGVVGVNWNVQLMALKFLDANGFGTTANAVQAVNYATAMRNQGVNVRVINASWVDGGYSQALHDAIQASGNAGILFIAAAGNGDPINHIGFSIDARPVYPASYNLSNIIAVAATDNQDHLAGFSNYGANSVHLGAPGVSILSTWPGGGYAYAKGTSMAAPHVTGVAALAWSYAPNATAQIIRTAILNGVDPVPALAGKTVTGGRLDAFNTLQNLTPNAGWSGWNTVGGITDVSLNSSAFNNRVYLFGKGEVDHGIYVTSTMNGTNWDGWSPIGGTTDAALSSAAFNGRLYLFAKGEVDHGIYVTSTMNGTNWDGWSPIGGTTDAALSSAVFHNRLYLFGKGEIDHGIYVNSMSNGADWSGWGTVGGITDVALGSTALGNRLYLFAKGEVDHGIYVNTLPGG